MLSGQARFTDVSALASLLELQSLILQCNSITDISALASLLALQSLDLQHDHLDDLRALSGLTQLQSLALSSCNSITDISALSALTHLQLSAGSRTFCMSRGLISDWMVNHNRCQPSSDSADAASSAGDVP